MSELSLPGRDARSDRPASAFGVLRYRDFRLLFAGMAAATFTLPMQWVTQMWLVLELTDGSRAALWLGITGFTRGLPLLVLSLYGGALADRFDKRTLLAITQVAAIAVTVTITALIALDLMTMWLFLPLIFLSSAVVSFDQPARQALAPELVPPELTSRAVALNSMAMFIGMAMGPAVGGLLIAGVGVAGTYGAIAAVYTAVLITVLLLPARSTPHPTLRRSARAEIAEGISFVRGEPVVRWLVSISFAVTILGMAYSNLMPILVTDVLHSDAIVLGWLATGWGVGAVLASLVIAGGLDRLPGKGLLLLGAIALFVAGLTGFGYATTIPLSLFFHTVAGVAHTVLVVISNTAILSVTPPPMRGRVMGIYYMNRGFKPFGALFAAALGEAAGVQHGVATLAIASGLAVIVITLLQPGAWRRVQTALA